MESFADVNVQKVFDQNHVSFKERVSMFFSFVFAILSLISLFKLCFYFGFFNVLFFQLSNTCILSSHFIVDFIIYENKITKF